MSETMIFDLVVEGRSEDPLVVAEPALVLKRLRWVGDSAPDVVLLPAGMILVKVGKYLSPGDVYSYRVATKLDLNGGTRE